MNTQDFKRKLTAVFSADVAGYSRLMGEDEAATVKTLEAYKQVMFSLIKQHRGRVIDSPGDNLLAEFASVVDAVQCGVAVQKELQSRNTELPENRKMQFRIGINLGDVIEEQDRIYGDGVNIAARLESCADPGGICVSKTAFDHIETKLPLGYEYLGEKEVKNIAKPVGAYRVLMEPRVTIAGAKEKKPSIPVWRTKGVLAGAVALLVVIIGVAVWNFYLGSPKIEPASKEKMAFPMPDKPSIAVLPFVNMSEDKSQGYFSDGLTEEIITALSKVPKIFVIARNSTFAYKGKAVKVNQIAEELGVRYVLEGSVRKSDDKVRITAQLIDALSGYHLWAEQYDREMKDIFALQDEITMKVINALQVELTEGEHARLWGKGTNNLQAYIKSLRARELYMTSTKESNALSRRLAEEAISLDPEFPPPYHFLAVTHVNDVLLGTTKSPKESLARAVELTQKAISLDDSYAVGHGFLGLLYTMIRKPEEGVVEAQKGVALDPNGAHGYLYLSTALRLAGKFEEAVQPIEKAIRLNPFPPVTYFRTACMAYIGVGRYEEAISAGKKAISVGHDDYMSHTALTAAYSLAGREEDARSAAEELLRVDPKFSINVLGKRLAHWDKRLLEQFLAALRKAGLPD